VTHDNRILDAADRIVNMVDGRIISDVVVRESAAICEFLQKAGVFQGLTPKTLSEVADKTRLERHTQGTDIVRQGDPGEKFYLIRTGEVDVISTSAGTPRVVARLREGDFFGEAALITGEPRNATVRAVTPLEVYTLGKDEFRAVMESSATLAEELRRVLFQRQ
ncbi:MAG: cyclic nucleotide-binding domain-containing protein, partial [Pirellulales bacterium]|nr:cyclic nucleotide-binding domain-containing protein [Pirellulales bacterium]